VLVAWVVFPLVLAALCGGAGLLVNVICRGRVPLALVPMTGFATLIVASQFLTLSEATAPLITPLCVALAVAGFGLGFPRWSPRAAWPLAAAAGVFAVYAAPIVLSGEPTVAGFIRLDDTATWLALTDRMMEHGRDLSGLPPSTYEATLSFNLADGYPVGVFLPFGAGAQLVPADSAWLVQPYMAFEAALLALCLWSLAGAIERPALRAAAAFIGAQSALLFGYYLWGGIKELAAAALVAGFAALMARALADPRDRGALVAPAVLAAALLAVLSGGGFVWLLPSLLAFAVLFGRAIGARATAMRALAFAGAVCLLALPLFLSGGLLPPTSSPLTDPAAQGNLLGPLDPAQAAGIWPSGDFRLEPDAESLALMAAAIAAGAAFRGLVWAWRRREPGAAVYVGGSLAAAVVLVAAGSPWVGGKALATAAPAIPFAAMLAVAWLAEAGPRAAAAVLATVVAGGVLWSNALGYGAVALAPHDQLAELERIGEEVAGEGPTLITEYSPYGARHFLRDSDPESISELRRRTIPLRDGETVPKGGSADTDAIAPAALAVYRTLVLRRSPSQSRPPALYELVWRGEHYEAWQRPPGPAVLAPRLPLGTALNPYGVPSCAAVRELAEAGDLVAAAGTPPVVGPPGALRATMDVERAGEYSAWVGGSIRPDSRLLIDGEPVGEMRHELNNQGGYVGFGTVALEARTHDVALEVGGADLHPGSAGGAGPSGPLVLSLTEAATTRLVEVPADEAASLCGRPWDWIEVRP
jgi:hypothetical protein